MVEEKTSKVVVPLTHKSGEHNDEQDHFRAESRQSGISAHPAVNENTGLKGPRIACFGLSAVEGRREDGREDRFMRTVTIPVKGRVFLSELVRRHSSMNPRTADYEGYVYQPRAYAGAEDPFIFIPYRSSNSKLFGYDDRNALDKRGASAHILRIKSNEASVIARYAVI